MAGVPMVAGSKPRRRGWLAAARRWARFGTEGYPKKVRRRLAILNLMAVLTVFFSVLFALTYALQDPREFAWEIAINIVLVGAGCAIPFAHRYGELAGSIILVVAEYIGIFALVALMGRASGIQLNLIAASTILFAILGLERIRLIIAILFVGFLLHVSAWMLFPGLRHRLEPWFLNQLYVSAALTVFAVTAAICWYAFALVEKAEEQNEELLRNVLPDVIAERLKEDPNASVADDFPDVSILFSDLEGFTPLSQSLGASQTVRILDDLVRGFDRLAALHGVEKIKTIGDAYMAASGVPEHVPDHAERLVRMALDMRDSARETALRYEARLTLRIGIAAGPVTAGVIGSRKFSYDVWGDPVNLAARLEEYSPSGGILISETVARALPADIRLACQGRREIRGVGEVETYLVLGPESRDDSARAAA